MGLIPKEAKEALAELPEFKRKLAASEIALNKIKDNTDLIADMVSVLFLKAFGTEDKDTIERLNKRIQERV